MSIWSKISRDNIPSHVAIIMDGNGRWAKKRGEHRLFGHTKGVDSIRNVLKVATEIGVKHLTLYAFSTENWNRPKEEIDGLMNLLVQAISNEIEEMDKNEVKLSMIGDDMGLPEKCRLSLKEAIDRTKDNSKINLILALNYSARWEILHAAKQMAIMAVNDKNKVQQFTNDDFDRLLTTKDIPHPELLIRTSGEKRISNFLLWQLAYSEFYFTDVLWPDFGVDDFIKAIASYQSRERRFGMVSEQINTTNE